MRANWTPWVQSRVEKSMGASVRRSVSSVGLATVLLAGSVGALPNPSDMETDTGLAADTRVGVPDGMAALDLTTDDVQAIAACYLATHFWPQRSERLEGQAIARSQGATVWSGRGLRDETGFVEHEWEKLSVRFDFSRFARNQGYYRDVKTIPFSI